MSQDQLDKAELRVFCDASEKAYASVIYVLSHGTQSGRISVFLTAKSKISPLKSVTIPHLELGAALLGTRLLYSVKAAQSKVEINIGDCHSWSDSTIVLCWLSNQTIRLTAVVANRVTKIQE